MDAVIRTRDRRRCGDHGVEFLNDTTYESVLTFMKKHKNACSVMLLKSPNHGDDGAFYTRDDYFIYMIKAEA